MKIKQIHLNPWLIITGGSMGIFFALLVKLGNPPNMGVCVLCFMREIAGAIGLHQVKNLSYIRPEFVGFIIGATISALIFGEFKSTGGAKLIWRFVIGAVVGFNGMIFLGCPIRMFGRIAGGDWTALAGLAGVIVGILNFNFFMKFGFTGGKAKSIPTFLGWFGPIFGAVLFILLVINFRGLNLSHKAHAPIYFALLAGLILGVLGQRSRFCSIGGTMDLLIIRNFNQVQGTIVLLILLFVANLVIGQFKPGQHPLAHNLYLWNFFAMWAVGLGSLMIGGCPFRQTVMAAQGSFDAFVAIVGMFIGIGIGHYFKIIASPSGVPIEGRVTTLISLVILFVICVIGSDIIKRK